MAATPAHRRRAFNTRGRSGGTPRARLNAVDVASSSEPPRKRRRYVPGGFGGGGHFLDPQASNAILPLPTQSPPQRARSRSRGAPQSAHSPATSAAPASEKPLRSEKMDRPERPRRETSRRDKPPPRPRYSSAAAVAAAVVQGDGFKPREERSWEEFHQDLDIDADLPILTADLVDGIAQLKPSSRAVSPAAPLTNGIHSADTPSAPVLSSTAQEATSPLLDELTSPSDVLRKRERQHKRADALLKGLENSPEGTRCIPRPGPNPREKLTLPKPTFQRADPFLLFEKTTGSIDYVDRTMASVGYQESDHFIRPEHGPLRWLEGVTEEDLDVVPAAVADGGEGNAAIGATGVGRVEYDMDEQDQKWLEAYNQVRRSEQVEPIKPAIFEITMTKIEKEWHALEKRIPKPNPKPPQTHRPRSSSAAAVNGEAAAQGEEQDSKCAICDDGDCENTNAIVFCDGCDLAVHQECYGVPFIPEGQWLCRRCHLVGRGTPTCIFCPNTDGAFKQTNSSKWAHLLCAIWIPEVSLGNMTFMEPVMDVEKVPKSRWKLRCVICQQQMGACIQCGNKNCFRAFHVTCGRRARWYLSMKSAQGGPANLESNMLKAFCDKHVPPDWRKAHDVERATADAIAFYEYHMRGKIWADSRQAITAATTASDSARPEFDTGLDALPTSTQKKKKGEPGRIVWRLPTGAPVIPQTLYESLEAALARFTVRKRKEFAADMCRYWTLKRQDKRGAALIKRLQLQMETFSSMEITRRNFAGMGATGAARLQRRIEFADMELLEVAKLQELCQSIRERELLKLQDAEQLRDLVDLVYFPVPTLLWPILEKAIVLDSKATFRRGLLQIRDRLLARAYASVSPFAADLCVALTSIIGLSVTDPNQIEAQIDAERHTNKSLTSEDKENRKNAKRIIKAVQGALQDAVRQESELCRRPYEAELLDIDQTLERSIASRRASDASMLVATQAHALTAEDGILEPSQVDLAIVEPESSDEAADNDNKTNGVAPSIEDVAPTGVSETKATRPTAQLTPESSSHAPVPDSLANGEVLAQPSSFAKPPTPPLSASDEHQTVLSVGGVPWYMEPFDPRGTTIYEERWMGRDVARGMSEELSDMDEAELSGLVDADVDVLPAIVESKPEPIEPMDTNKGAVLPGAPTSTKKKNGKMKKRWRGFR